MFSKDICDGEVFKALKQKIPQVCPVGYLYNLFDMSSLYFLCQNLPILKVLYKQLNVALSNNEESRIQFSVSLYLNLLDLFTKRRICFQEFLSVKFIY